MFDNPLHYWLPMTLSALLFANLAAIAVAALLLWLLSMPLRNVSIVDIFWGSGFAGVAWLSLWLTESPSARALLLVALVTLWGLRLAGYLGWRNWGKEEDYRYREMRDHHGSRFPLVSLLTVFGLQGLIMWVVSLPIQVAVFTPGSIGSLTYLGTGIWLAGFLFESIGDWQLASFKSDPNNKGQVMNRGLWRYTRHPNYFGDFLVWWGLFLVAADASSWWWTIVSPLLMSFLLIRVSGVRLLENSLGNRLNGYQQYVSETSAFFPWPPSETTASK